MSNKQNVVKIGIAFVILIIAVVFTATIASPTDQTFPEGYPKYSVYADIASDIVMENINHNYGANYSHNRNSQWIIEQTQIPMQKPDYGKNYSHNRNSQY